MGININLCFPVPDAIWGGAGTRDFVFFQGSRQPGVDENIHFCNRKLGF